MTSFIDYIDNTVIKLTIYFNVARDKIFTKIMLPMLKLNINYGFHDFFSFIK